MSTTRDWLEIDGYIARSKQRDGIEPDDYFAQTEPPRDDGGEAESNSTLLEFPCDIRVETHSNDIVQDLFGPGDLVLPYGPPGGGKTFLTLDMGMRIAHGLPIAGRRTRAAAIVYVGYEGGRGIRKRVAAAIADHGDPGRMFALLRIDAPLDRGPNGIAGVTKIIAAVRELKAASRCDAVVVIVDTLSRAIAGDDENSANDLSAFIQHCAGAISRATGAAIIAVHHTGKDVEKGLRGSSAILGAADSSLLIHENTVTIEKPKEAESGPWFGFKLRRVVLDRDDHGDEISTCVVDILDQPPEPKRTTAKLSPRFAKALDILKRLDDDKALEVRGSEIGIDGAEPGDPGAPWTAEQFGDLINRAWANVPAAAFRPWRAA